MPKGMRPTPYQLEQIQNRTKQPKVNKYRNVKTGGYDSRKECNRALELKQMAKAGLIVNLEEQPVYELVPKQEGERAVKYKADFRYMENGELVVEDVKSEITKRNSDYIIKRKLMLHVHGIRVKEV